MSKRVCLESCMMKWTNRSPNSFIIRTSEWRELGLISLSNRFHWKNFYGRFSTVWVFVLQKKVPFWLIIEPNTLWPIFMSVKCRNWLAIAANPRLVRTPIGRAIVESCSFKFNYFNLFKVELLSLNLQILIGKCFVGQFSMRTSHW